MGVIKTILIISLVILAFSIILGLVNSDVDVWKNAKNYCEEVCGGEFKSMGLVGHFKCLVEKEDKLYLYKVIKYKDKWRLIE